MSWPRKPKAPCKNGNLADRDGQGRCTCDLCVNQRRIKMAEYSRKWSASNKEKRNASVKHWRDRNPERVAEMNRKAGRNWSKNNKGARNAITMRRIASLIQRTPSWANFDAIKKIYNLAAKITEETGIPHEVDHIIPLQGKTVSGLHVETNLQIITRTKNRAKHNRIMDT